MNREIKFRAYDKDNKKMIDVRALDFTDDGKILTINYPEGKLYPNEEYGHHVAVMQYTGLKDSKGVEIYEGDICKYLREEMILSIRRDITGANWQFDEHNTIDDGVGRGNWDFTLGIAKYCEIIGNIYENTISTS